MIDLTNHPFSSFSYQKKPIWIYCAQGANTPASHCGKGMVFAVNPAPSPDGAESYGRFKAKALEIGKKLAGYY